MTRQIGGGLVVLCLVLTGVTCKKVRDSKEFNEFKEGHLSVLDANQTKVCKRPVLRGEARSGDGGELLLSIYMEPKTNQECLSAVRSLKRTDLRLGINIDPVARALDDSIADMPDVRTAERLCIGLVDEIQTVLLHESSCSPFQFGRHGMPDANWTYRAALIYRAMSLRARGLARDGRVTQAFQVILDGARLYQDAARGGVDWETASTSVGHWATILSVVAEMILNTEKDGPDFKQISKEIDSLLAEEPHPSTHIQAEDLNLTVKAVMPAIMGKEWVPPGGWGYGQALQMQNLATKGALVETWYKTQETADRFAEACPKGSFWFRCIQGLYGVHDSIKDDYLKDDMDPATETDTKKGLTVTLAKVRLGGLQHRYLQRRALGPLTLVAMRTHLVFREIQDSGGGCPSIESFTKEPLRSALYAEFFGGRLVVKPRPAGGYYLLPPDNYSTPNKKVDDPLWTLICRD
ncbi:MAG: hypothetical protein CMH54_01375 [Myxococcales bacterium]|nr:hypothetical protein [Myxococcales bacterium]|tara:strand:+ start:1815 stop:3206 length:1392 start_codon:yes stop_codon:yes gene_type:complete